MILVRMNFQHQQPPASNRDITLNKELCETMIGVDKFRAILIVLGKNILEKLPHQTTLRKYYVADKYKETIDILRKKFDGKKLWVSIDYKSVCDRRYVAYLVFGTWRKERTKYYLGNTVQLESVNYSTIAAFLNDSLGVLWPKQVLSKNASIVISEVAPYMYKAMQGLQMLFDYLLISEAFIFCNVLTISFLLLFVKVLKVLEVIQIIRPSIFTFRTLRCCKIF